MARLIPQPFIDDLIAAANIVDIINARVSLRKQGSSFVALCPFHDEKTPSFNVIPEKHFYYCHGCGAHGNAIGFLMQYDRMEFIEAVKYLANDLGFTLPEEGAEQAQDARVCPDPPDDLQPPVEGESILRVGPSDSLQRDAF